MEIRRTCNGISIDPKENSRAIVAKKAGSLKVYWVLCFMHPKVWLIAAWRMELQKITLIFNITRTKHVILFESVWLFPNSDLWFCLGSELCPIVPDGWLVNGVWAVVGFTLPVSLWDAPLQSWLYRTFCIFSSECSFVEPCDVMVAHIIRIFLGLWVYSAQRNICLCRSQN